MLFEYGEEVIQSRVELIDYGKKIFLCKLTNITDKFLNLNFLNMIWQQRKGKVN